MESLVVIALETCHLAICTHRDLTNSTDALPSCMKLDEYARWQSLLPCCLTGVTAVTGDQSGGHLYSKLVQNATAAAARGLQESAHLGPVAQIIMQEMWRCHTRWGFAGQSMQAHNVEGLPPVQLPHPVICHPARKTGHEACLPRALPCQV